MPNNIPINYSDQPWTWKGIGSNAVEGLNIVRQFNKDRLTVENLSYDEVELYGIGKSRFDEGAPEWALSDLNEWRAQNQSGLEQIANGVLKGAITTGTTFANTLVGIPVGVITAAAEGRLSGIWDNAITNTMSNIDEWAEKELPNYYTKEEQENPWYQNIFTANFLGDKLIKNFGFTLGAGAAGKVISKMPKLLTTIAPKIARATGTSAQNIASIGRVTNTFETGLISAIGEGSIEALNATKEWSAAMTNQINQEQALKLQTLQQEYEDGLNNILQRYGDTELGHQLALNYQNEIQKRASDIENETNQKMAQVASQRAQIGNAVLGFNLPILTLSNMALLGRVYAKGWTAEQQSLGRFISSDMSKLAAAGTTTSQTTRNILGKEITKDVVNNVYKNNLTLARNILRGGKQAAGEGIEEMSQLIASNTAKAYNNDYYAQSVDPNATDRTADMWYSLAHQFGETLGDISNWEEFFIGMVSGGISNIVLGANKGLSQERRDVQNLVDALNERVNTFNNRNLIQGLNRHGQYGDQMVESAIRGDKKDFKDAEFAQTVSDVIMWSEAGKLDDLKQIIDYNLDNNLSDDELESIAESLSQKDAEGGEHNSFAAGSNSYRRQYIQDQKDKYHKVVDMYTTERNNIVGLVGSTFSKEELSELTYLRMRAQDSANRSEELKDSLLKKIDAFAQRNLGEQSKAKIEGIDAIKIRQVLKKSIEDDLNLIRSFEKDKTFAEGLYNRDHQGEPYYEQLKADVIKKANKRIEKYTELLKKHQDKALTNEAKINILGKIFNVSGSNKTSYDSALSFIKDNFNQIIDLNANKLNAGNVFEVAQNINNLVSILSSIQGNETTIKELETTIEDAVRLVNDANTYNQKLNEFINNPAKLTTKNEGLVERARNRKIEKDANRAEQDIANTENFNEFSQKLDNLNPRVREKVLKNLKNKQNKNALDYESKSQAINLVLDYINSSDTEPIIKQTTIAVFTNAAGTLNEDALLNIDSFIYSREANRQLDDETYVRVKTLLAQAFNYQKQETSEPSTSDPTNAQEKSVVKNPVNAIPDFEELPTIDQDEIDAIAQALAERSAGTTEDDSQEDSKQTINFDEEPFGGAQGPVPTAAIIEATVDTHGFMPDESGRNISPINLKDNNLTSIKALELDSTPVELSTPEVQQTRGRAAVGMSDVDTKAGSSNYGKPVIEEVDKKGNPTNYAKNSQILYNRLKDLGTFDNLRNGVAQKDSKVRFAIWPSLDREIKEKNNYDGTTVLLYIDGKCVGHLPTANPESAGAKLGIANLLKEEFKGKLNTEDILISSKYYTTVEEMWSGIIVYDENNNYKTVTSDDLTWIKNRINSSSSNVTESDKTPLLTIFDGNIGFVKDGSTVFRYGTEIAPVYLKNKPYKGAPVLLVPSGAYDRNKPNTQQANNAYIPVMLRRTKFEELDKTTETYRIIENLINKLFRGKDDNGITRGLKISEINEVIGNLKSELTYEYNTSNGKQQIFIVPSRQSSNDPSKIIPIDPKGYTNTTTKYEDLMPTHLTIQLKLNNSLVKSYTFGIAQGSVYQTVILQKDIVDNNKDRLLDFFLKEANAYVNIDKNKLNKSEYIDRVFNDGLVKTNATELKTKGASFAMVNEVMIEGVTNPNQPQEEITGQENIKNTEIVQPEVATAQENQEEYTNPLMDLLGPNFNSTEQPETSNDAKYSRVNNETKLATINVEKEVDNICRMLPQLDRESAFEIVNDLININDKGDKAQGVFNKGLMTISKLAEAGTGYHEAFHLVFNMILTSEEKSALMLEYKSNYPTYSDLELEEQMADDFSEYSILRETNQPTTFFERLGKSIINAFKRLFNHINLYKNHPTVFQTISSDIWQGKYAERQLKDTDAVKDIIENDDIRYSLPLTTKIAKSNLSTEEYNDLRSLSDKINTKYRIGRNKNSFAIQFREENGRYAFRLTQNYEHKIVNGIEVNIPHLDITKKVVDKYLKDNNLTNKYKVVQIDSSYELVINDEIPVITKEVVVDETSTDDNNKAIYDRIIAKQRRGYTLTEEEELFIQEYSDIFETKKYCYIG